MPSSPRTCTKCHKSKPLSDFRHSATSRDGYFYICADCQAENSRQSWRETHALDEIAATHGDGYLATPRPAPERPTPERPTPVEPTHTVTLHVGEGIVEQPRERERREREEAEREAERVQRLAVAVTERVAQTFEHALDTALSEKLTALRGELSEELRDELHEETRELVAVARSAVTTMSLSSDAVASERLTLLETWVTEPVCSPRGEYFAVDDLLIRRYGDRFTLYVNDSAARMPAAPHEDITAEVLIFLVRVTLRVASDADVYGVCYR